VASSVTIQQLDPLGLAAQAVGDVNANRRSQALQNAAETRANAAEGRANTQLGLQQQAGARDAQRLTDTEGQTTVENVRAQAAADLAAKKEANDELDKAAAAALALLKEQNAKTKNDQDFAAKVAALKNALAIAKANIAKDYGVANIHASAQLGAANISAAAHVEAAGISAGASEYGTDVRHGDAVHREAVVKRGQDLTVARTEHGQNLAHGDRVASRNYGMDRAALGRLLTATTAYHRQKGAIPSPSPQEDPSIDEHVHDFAKLTPKGRDAMLALPDAVLPAKTKAYLSGLLQPLMDAGQ
jgi:multidrug efflux pump subunit AcrA (membrane-fusion protein)